MAKRELEGGYQPLRHWERLFAYVSFIIMMSLMFGQAKLEGVSWRLMLFMVTGIIAAAVALVAFWDARVAARLLRRERQQQLAEAQLVFGPDEPWIGDHSQPWAFFADKQPTTSWS